LLLTKILFYGNIKEKGNQLCVPEAEDFIITIKILKFYRAEGTKRAVYPCAFFECF